MNKKSNTDEFIKKLEKYTHDWIALEEYKGANTNIKFKHLICGKENDIRPSNLLNSVKNGKSGCKYCGNNSKKYSFEFIKQEIEKEGYKVLSTTAKNTKDLLVIQCKNPDCPSPTKSFKMSYNDFQQGHRCRWCQNIADLTLDIVKQKINKLDSDYICVSKEYINSSTKLEVKHLKCGETYPVTWTKFKAGRRCPACNSSKGELRIRKILNSRNIPFEYEYPYPNMILEKNLRFDFYFKLNNIEMAIEFDGIQHFSKEKTFGSKEKKEGRFEKTIERDNFKNEFCKKNNIKLLRIKYDEIENMEEIIDKFLS